MLCPQCQHATQVKDTRGNFRRRSCMNINCGHRFSTEESVTERQMPRSVAAALKISREPEAVAELRATVARLEAQLAEARMPTGQPERKPAPPTPSRVKLRQPVATKPTQPERPAAFFSRESLVETASMHVREEQPAAAAPAWVPRLPLAAYGRMR